MRSSTSSAAEDQPTIVETTEVNDIYMDETRVYGQTDLLTGLPAQMAPTLNFTMGSDQVLRTEDQNLLDDQRPLIDLDLGSLTVEKEPNELTQLQEKPHAKST